MSAQLPATILYVDDDETNRHTFGWIFRSAGFDVKEAASGREALRLAAEKPDLVVLDVNLPDINGFEVCHRIKTHPATSSIPVLHLSACFIQSDDRIHGFESGADGYLTKPVEPEELIAQVKALLRIHAAEEKARAAARQWQATFDAISDGVCLLDRSGRVLRCNQALTRILQKPAAEILGLDCHELLPANAGTDKESVFERMLRGRRRDSMELFTGNRWLQVIADPRLEEDGSLAGAVCLLSDITERKRLEEQLRQAQKMEAIGHLAGGVAHDFNNLLTVITGHVSLLREGLAKEEPNQELLRTIEHASDRAAELVRQLMGFSRQTRLWLKPTNLHDCVEEIVAFLHRTIDPRVKVEVKSTPGLWAVHADQGQINQVLMNLCLNARDAMPAGGRLLLETENVVLDEADAHQQVEARPGEFVRLRVQDSGHGIPPDIRPRIFEPFFTTKDPGRGTGLGLAMVFGIVKQHHGWIECYSEVNQGTHFDIYLPRLPDEPATLPPPAHQPGPAGGASGTILLVDDEPMLRNLGCRILQQHGYQVLLAEDGRQAVEIYRREQQHIDLVILDLTMPHLSGRDALQQLLQINPHVRVVLASGYFSEDVTESRPEGALSFISKPYRDLDLVNTVRSILDQAKAGGK